MPDTKQRVGDFLFPEFLALKLSIDCYALRTPSNNKAHLGVLHVTLPRTKNTLRCSAGAFCPRLSVGVAKKTVKKLLCVHEEIVALIDDTKRELDNQEVEVAEDLDESEFEEEDDTEEANGPNQPKMDNIAMKYLEETSKYIYENEKIDLTDENMANKKKEIIKQNKKGWPSNFISQHTKCPNCGNENMCSPKSHRGLTQSYLLSLEHCQPVTIQSQECNKCYILHQPKHPLLINIGDKLMVTLDVFYLLRSILYNGGPISTGVNIVLDHIAMSCSYMEAMSQTQKAHLNRILTAGFFAIEALDKDEVETQLCVICGIIPEINLSDGGEDICVKLSEDHFEITEGFESGEFTQEAALDF